MRGQISFYFWNVFRVVVLSALFTSSALFPCFSSAVMNSGLSVFLVFLCVSIPSFYFLPCVLRVPFKNSSFSLAAQLARGGICFITDGLGLFLSGFVRPFAAHPESGLTGSGGLGSGWLAGLLSS